MIRSPITGPPDAHDRRAWPRDTPQPRPKFREARESQEKNRPVPDGSFLFGN
jgi:hypothetical protein